MKTRKRSGDRRPRAVDPTRAVDVLPHVFFPTWAKIEMIGDCIIEEVRCAICGEKTHD